MINKGRSFFFIFSKIKKSVPNITFGNKYSNNSNQYIHHLFIDNLTLKYTYIGYSVGVALNVEISSGITRMLDSYYFLFVIIIYFIE
jgi:hypothetical protein